VLESVVRIVFKLGVSAREWYMQVVHFFFQAEDGIRDRNVTGVQTCALPIYLSASLGCPFPPPFLPFSLQKRRGAVPRGWEQQPAGCQRSDRAFQRTEGRNRDGRSFMPYRSEFLDRKSVV